MRDFVKQFEEMFDKAWFQEHTLALYAHERKQTFPGWQKGTDYIYALLKAEGFDAERINFPGDGKTLYQDKCMPIGWDVSTMRLTVKTPVPGLLDPVIADYEREPLHAVKHSVATPPEGLEVSIITESQMKMGADVKGALVLLDHRTQPRMAPVRMLLDLGAIGWVSDYSEDPHKSPDTVYWGNSETEYGVWHVCAGDREFISFQISERSGAALRQACNNGTVKAHVLSDARRYETEFPAVSALLPGEDPREIWVIAHNCEPLIDDDANGVIASIALLKALRELAASGQIQLKYSVRVVFAAELYGLSALCEYYGGDLSKRTIGGINMDGFTSSTDKSARKELKSREGTDLPGFAGNLLLRCADAHFQKHHPEYRIVEADHALGDDTFFGDSTIGMPVVWLMHNPYGYHHNSAQDPSIMDEESAAENFAYAAEWVRLMTSTTEEEILELLPGFAERAERTLEEAAHLPVRPGTDMQARMAFLHRREVSRIRGLSLWADPDKIEPVAAAIKMPVFVGEAPKAEAPTVWFDYAENFVFLRKMRGFPHNIPELPRDRWNMSYGGMLYNAFAEVFSKMDGKKTLCQAIREAEWDKGNVFPEKEIRTWLHRCISFAELGYLGMTVKAPLTEDALLEALRELGVKPGETLLVHSGLAGLGYLQGGTDAAISALRRAVGEKGTFLAPAFSFPFLMFDGDVNKGYQFRPYDTRPDGTLRDKTVRTGLLPRAMLKEKDAFRSGHATHEWVAIGAEAEACVAGHGLLDAPTGENSPLKKALDRDGSVVFLGCRPGANTFIHYAEISGGVPYAEPTCIQYVDEEGRTRTTMIDKELFGCRNFYGDIDNDFYREAVRRGLRIYTQNFGLAVLYRMELRQLYEIIQEMLREDPFALLCKKPDCPFCRRFIRR